ncbi:hypothetical protein ACHAW5_007120 [Stephanodiscus triporus]|uniref:Uncharacterized protein n=1 Tax=Stephanodiscus triporus TaxID=2934178 RepID=A0ABD3NXM6_9STRA
MSTLRQKKKDHVPKEDVEALISPDVNDAASSSSSSSYPMPGTTVASSSHHHLHNNPVIVAKMVLRKVGRLLLTNDEEGADDVTTFGGIIALMKDIVIGITLGMIGVSTLVFLDHRNVIHLPLAHKYREAVVFAMVADPETRETIEGSTGLIFMTEEDHERNIEEINLFDAQIKESEVNTKKYVADLMPAKEEYETVKRDYDKFMADPWLVMELDKFCGECRWQGRTNCDACLNYIIQNHGLRTIAAKLAVVEQAPQCVKTKE